MAQEFSFDVVSEVDLQNADNAVNTANRELQTRFDFKGSVSRIDLDKKDNKITILSDNEGKLKSVIDILQNRLIKQGISLKALDFQKIEPAEGGTVRQVAKVAQGIPSDKAKDMVRALKDAKLKVNPSIQGEQLRVTGKSKDDLQAAMALLRGGDFGPPVQFKNFR
ncbi:MAG TPA: YajQ family cyclic di-GMP-binding protein [Elusimicrobiota bacterium]|nr:YajQ family cyclic di-GMP-binding protein [Elusimicrobiota bacterium]HMU95479.1 YajQ family cyclic di-GMP-binding protein [Elusimicrobiota bacterium]HMX42390.1 YajQ family cyclic di-GMP-binding protein [Elusimicrobiota bacterium]HMX94495.1 YajQ family cyclic di-GMP-binding protein [Elusimicrobiota bacterium]HMZ26910.1 YajQ family cyclic di-GMP-binding protein [Elusimicrobiota bacterium]